MGRLTRMQCAWVSSQRPSRRASLEARRRDSLRTGKTAEVASPAGLEPATCGLEIRCCYPAELRGRDRKLLPQERLHLPAPQRAAPTGIARGSAAWGERRDARTFFLPLFPHGAKLA